MRTRLPSCRRPWSRSARGFRGAGRGERGGEGLSVCVRGFGSDEHLFAAVDQPLLYWRDTLLLLDLLLNLGDLDLGRVISNWDRDTYNTILYVGIFIGSRDLYLVVRLDVELDLLSGQRAHSVCSLVSPRTSDLKVRIHASQRKQAVLESRNREE